MTEQSLPVLAALSRDLERDTHTSLSRLKTLYGTEFEYERHVGSMREGSLPHCLLSRGPTKIGLATKPPGNTRCFKQDCVLKPWLMSLVQTPYTPFSYSHTSPLTSHLTILFSPPAFNARIIVAVVIVDIVVTKVTIGKAFGCE